MAYIFVGSYAKIEVDGSVRYRDIAINVKWGKKIAPQGLVRKSFLKFTVTIYQSWDVIA